MCDRPMFIAAFAACVLCGATARAGSVLEVRDGVTAEAAISAAEPTRIRAAGAKISNVVGNIYSSSCAAKAAESVVGVPAAPLVNRDGDFTLACDLAKGEVFLSPVGTSKKPITVFVSTDKATYTLSLRRAEVPGGTLVLSDTSTQAPAATAGPIGKNSSYVRSLKSMLLLMALAKESPDIRVERNAAARPLWDGARFILQRTYSGRGLVGEQYRLTNTGTSAMVLAEQEFDRENVVAVAVEQLSLNPGESTAVYVIRMGE